MSNNSQQCNRKRPVKPVDRSTPPVVERQKSPKPETRSTTKKQTQVGFQEIVEYELDDGGRIASACQDIII
jgi:hypothetical protein